MRSIAATPGRRSGVAVIKLTTPRKGTKPPFCDVLLLQIDDKRKTPKEIPRRLITLEGKLGQGAFGEVSLGFVPSHV